MSYRIMVCVDDEIFCMGTSCEYSVEHDVARAKAFYPHGDVWTIPCK
jgi:hypothetical protein